MGKKLSGRPPKFIAKRFEGLPCSAKLIWYHILSEGQGVYTVSRLAQDLGMTTASSQRAMKSLINRGLLDVIEPARGSRAGVYRASAGEK